ncbi:unnamed protein product [Caenorhabditis brenneri]
MTIIVVVFRTQRPTASSKLSVPLLHPETNRQLLPCLSRIFNSIIMSFCDQKRRREVSPQQEQASHKKMKTSPEDMNENNELLLRQLREMTEERDFYKEENERLVFARKFWIDESRSISTKAKQLKRDKKLLHEEILKLKNTISDLEKNREDALEREEGEISDSDDDDVVIQDNICGYTEKNMDHGRFKGIVINVKTVENYPDPTIISQNHIYSTKLGLLYSNNRKKESMEMGSTYEFAFNKNKHVDKGAQNYIYRRRAVDWHGVQMSQIQTSSNPDFEATIDFHHCQIQEKEGEYYVMHETLNKVTMGKRFYDRLDSTKWVREVENPPSRQTMRIRAKVNLVENYLEAIEKNRDASIFRIKELVTVVNCHNSSLLPVEGLTAFKKNI